MTTKKSTKKQPRESTNSRRSPVEERARGIIADVRGHDVDTRHAVEFALNVLTFWRDEARTHRNASTGLPATSPGERRLEVKRAEARLREAVRKAEAGECAFDIEEIGAKYAEAARAVHSIISDAGAVPQFVSAAVMTALDEAARRARMEIWLSAGGEDERDIEGGDYSVERLARLFRRCETMEFRLEPEKDLAELISAVLRHDETPPTLYNAMADALTPLTGKTEVGERSEVIAAALKVHKAEAEREWELLHREGGALHGKKGARQ